MRPLNEEMLAQLSPEEADNYRRAYDEKLQMFGLSFAKERMKYIDGRTSSGVERRWNEDLDFYHGRDRLVKQGEDMMARIAEHGEVSGLTRSEEKVTRSRVFLNITRPKTNSAEARIADMLLPVDERNWGIKPTPVPELAEQVHDKQTGLVQNGEPVMVNDPASGGERQATASDAARAVIDMAVKAASKMQDEIDDQLTECDYNAECRLAIRDAARLGTGILKGPVVTNKMRKSWQPMPDNKGGQIQMLKIVEEKGPSSYRVDPWDFYPDMACGFDVKHAEAIWERKRVSARELRSLAQAPGYMADRIREVLKEGPRKTGDVDVALRYRDDGGTRIVQEDTRYELWERHGDVPKDVLEACGCNTDQMDELAQVSGCVVLVNNTVIKAYLNPLDTQDLIYDVYTWEPAEDTIFGYGVPYLLRQASQRIIVAGVRQMLDNAGRSTGPQIVVGKSIEPADGKWEITGSKIWKQLDDGNSIREAFGFFEINSHIDEYIKLIELGLKFADEEIALPMIMAGERGSAPEQVGSMQMLMNAATTVLRRLVKRFDDQITKRHIRRYYDWNMQYNPKSEIKGDYEVDARGSTALLQRDLQNQAIIKWISALTNPVIGWMFEEEKMLRKALQADYIVPDDVLKTSEEIKRIRDARAKQPPQPSPDALVKSQAAMQMAQIHEQGESSRAADDRQLELLLRAMDSDVALRDLLQKRGTDLTKLKGALAQQAMKIRQDREAMQANPPAKVVAVT